jgi:hypothetical protein
LNKKQKILSVVALAAFSAVIGLHYVGFDPYPEVRPPNYKSDETRIVMNDNVINDVRMPLFVLAVFYAGLFFILQDKRAG